MECRLRGSLYTASKIKGGIFVVIVVIALVGVSSVGVSSVGVSSVGVSSAAWYQLLGDESQDRHGPWFCS